MADMVNAALRTKVQRLQRENAELRAKLEAAEADTRRLDWLDAQNARKNKQNRTTYGWRIEENCNRIALSNCHFPAIPVRSAMDAAMDAQK